MERFVNLTGRTGAAAAVVASGLALALGGCGGSADRGPAARGPSAAGSRATGPTPAGAAIHFSLVLRLDQRRVSRFLGSLYDPRSPSYRHFIGAAAFGRRFGISTPALRRLTGLLAADGVQVEAVYPQRTAIDVEAPAATVNAIFGAQMTEYRAPTGREYHASPLTPRVPAAWRRSVTGVAGLDGRYPVLGDDVPPGGLRPGDAGSAYDIKPLYDQGIQGQGETIGILSFATFPQSDLDAFDRQFGLPAFIPLSASPSQTGPATDGNPDDQGEVLLDLEVAHEIAPQATIIDYNAPFTDQSGADTFGMLIDRVVSDGQAQIVSDSWGACELSTDHSDIQRDEQAIEAAVAHGISIFKSTGDAGAYQCQRDERGDHRLSVEWPASSPGVVAVGGTSLQVSPSGAYAGEAAWEDALTQGGGGGGLSALFPRPSWQAGPGVQSSFTNGRRQIPDVAAAADPDTGWATVSQGQLGETGGTSAASPFWAAAASLIAQYAQRHGVRQLGFLDPSLYAIAAAPQPTAAFHDVTDGGNRYYPATPGWDFATGLGSPDVFGLAQDLVAYLKAHGA